MRGDIHTWSCCCPNIPRPCGLWRLHYGFGCQNAIHWRYHSCCSPTGACQGTQKKPWYSEVTRSTILSIFNDLSISRRYMRLTLFIKFTSKMGRSSLTSVHFCQSPFRNTETRKACNPNDWNRQFPSRADLPPGWPFLLGGPNTVKACQGIEIIIDFECNLVGKKTTRVSPNRDL